MIYSTKKRVLTGLIFLMFAFAFTGCAKKDLIYEKLANHIYIEEDSAYGKIKMNFDKLDGENIRAFVTKKGDMYEFDYEYHISNGDIKIIIADFQENILEQTMWNSEKEQELKKEKGDTAIVNGSGGVFNVKSTDEKIHIIIAGKDATGDLKIEW